MYTQENPQYPITWISLAKLTYFQTTISLTLTKNLYHENKILNECSVIFGRAIYPSTIEWDCLCVGLTLPPRLIFKVVNAFWISIVMALSTLPEESFLCDFWRWSLSELLLSPAFLPQMGHIFIIGFRCCHSIETLPCNFWSSSSKIFAKPSLGWDRRWTRFRAFHASNKVNFLQHEHFSP